MVIQLKYQISDEIHVVWNWSETYLSKFSHSNWITRTGISKTHLTIALFSLHFYFISNKKSILSSIVVNSIFIYNYSTFWKFNTLIILFYIIKSISEIRMRYT